MDSRTCLDYALFQLTPTRTRCDLVIFSGKEKEKLASGLLEPFLCHLKSAKDQISKGGYSITLRPSTTYASWFTKATLQRFVKFVTSPEVLERFVTIEQEIVQIENEQTSVASQVEGEFNGNGNAEHEENPKIRLQRVLETRRAVLMKEQAMAYARALVSGFETDNIEDLITFANAFGAMRLREACISFLDLCTKKSNDGIWLDEVAAMQACAPSEFSYFEKSGISLQDTMMNFRNVSTPKSSISHGSSDAHQDNTLLSTTQVQQTDGKAQSPSWPHHFPQFMQSFHGYGFPQMPQFPGYNFPGTQVPYSSRSLDHESDESWKRSTFSRRTNRKKSKENDDKSESSDTTSGSDDDSDDEYVERKERRSSKHRKGSSRKVVIRNINYIASKRHGEDDGSSGDSSGEDADSPKGQVEQAIAAFEKSKNMSHSKKKRDEKKRNNDKTEEGTENAVAGDAEKDNINKSWGIFQDLLMNIADSSSNNTVKTREDEISAIDAQSERSPKQNGLSNDSFLATARDLNNEDKFHLQNLGTEESVYPVNKKEIANEELLFPKRISDQRIFGGDYIQESFRDHATDEKTKKDILVDESLMVQARPIENANSGPKDDIFMVSDIVGASQPDPKMPDHVQVTNVNEPDDLYMVLDRDFAADQVEASWINPEMDHANAVVRPTGSVDEKIPQNGKVSNTKISKGKPTRNETNSRNPVSHVRNKGGIASTIKKSPSASVTPRSKAVKEDENRKKMEELALQRQRRIAERSSSSVAKAPMLKKSTKESKSAASVKVEKPKIQASVKVEKPKIQASVRVEKPKLQASVKVEKSQKPVMKSSTIERLATTRKNLKPSSEESKNNQTKKKITREKNGAAAASVPKPAGNEKKKVKPLDKSSVKESVLASVTPDEVQVKECSTENIKEIHSVSSVEKNETSVSNKGNDQKPDSPAASEMYKSCNEISPTEISNTSPSDEAKHEALQSRKKWIDEENSPRIAKGIRKFLFFGRKI